MEVALRCCAVFDVQYGLEGLGQRNDDPAFDLAPDSLRVGDDPVIGRGDDPIHLDRAVLQNRHLSHGSQVSAEAEHLRGRRQRDYR